MKYKYYFLLFCITLASLTPFTTIAQNLRTARTSSYFTYIYKITNDQLAKCYQKSRYFIDLEKELTLIVDSFPSDSSYKKELPPGAYVEVKAMENYLEYELRCINSFDVSVYSNKHDLMLLVYDPKNGQPVTNAFVQLGNRTIPYDSVTHTYTLPGIRRSGILSVKVNDEAAFYTVNRERRFGTFGRRMKYHLGSGWKKARIPFERFYYRLRYAGPQHELAKTSYRFNYKPRYSGYIALNKPKYLPHDTVKIKAFFLRGRSSPMEHDVKLLLCKRNEAYNMKQVAWTKTSSPGAYSCQFVLGDSLTLNTWYTLVFQDKKTRSYIMTRDFLLEDYQLNETHYEIRSPLKEFRKGEPMALYAIGTDANGLNLLDARVKITIKVKHITTFLADSLFVPDRLWQYERKLDPLGETKILVPDSLMPYAKLDLDVQAQFNNSNNETHDTSFVVVYDGVREFIRARAENDTIKADHFLKGANNPTQGVLTKQKVNGFEEKQTISFPYSEKIDATTLHYIFTTGSISEQFTPGEDGSRIECFTKRTGDSVFILFTNPLKLPVTYNIYKNGNIQVDKGVTTELDKKLEDKSGCSYNFTFNYIWNGQVRSEQKNILLFKNNLEVKIDQPANIYPGQTTRVRIKVTDPYNKPIENVNLTAGAYNNQFGDARFPGVPYLGKSIRAYEGANNFLLARNALRYTKYISERWRNRMHLDTMPFYQFTFPANGIRFNYDSVGVSQAQISPFLYHRGSQVPVYLVYIDHRPVYWFGATNSEEYVFTEWPGYHTITLRARDKVYTLDSVLLKRGYKLDLSIDTAHVPARVRVEETDHSLTHYERSLICSNTLYILRNYYNRNITLWQGHKVFVDSDYGYNSWVKLFGFAHDSMNFYRNDDPITSFFFEGGYDYSLHKRLIKMRYLGFSEESGDLPAMVERKPLGLLPTTLPSRPSKKFNSLKHVYTYNPWKTDEGHGRYEFQYEGDSLISLIHVTKNDNNLGRFVEGSSRTINDLEPGYYTFTLITPSHFYLTRRNVLIKRDGVMFERFGDAFHLYPSIKDSISSWDTLITTKYYYESGGVSTGKVMYGKPGFSYGGSMLKVTVTDKKTKEAIPFAAAVVYQNNAQVAGGQADFDGNIIIKPIPYGRYTVKIVYVGYQTMLFNDVWVRDDKPTYLNATLYNEGVDLQAVAIEEYRVPLIDKDTKSGGTVNRESFMHMADKSINSVVSTQAGVYQQDFGYGYDNRHDINVRGARPGGTVYFVDGERMIGTSNLSQQAVDSDRDADDGYAAFDPYTVLASAPEANLVRSKFSDYGYWQPNLITDANGEASFDVTFPQNVTSWKAFALAMDARRHSGAGFKETRAFKNIMASLAVPRFLVQGDTAFAVGKILNYTSAAPKIKSQFKINGQLVSSHDTIIKTAIIESLILNPHSTDSMKASYSSVLSSTLQDGEEKNIPVMPIGCEQAYGDLYTLNGDTTITVELGEGENKLYAIDNSLDLMLKEIEDLKNYPYWCMEQTASKLNALLMEKHIKKTLNKPFNEENMIAGLLQRLEKGQKESGGWGWWADSPENAWMSAYVSSVVNKAVKDGYTFKNKEKALRYLAYTMHTLKGNELLTVLNTLSEMKFAIPYDEHFKEIRNDSANLNLYQKLMMTKILQENGYPYDLTLIEKEKKQTMMGNYYWGNETYNWYDNNIKTTLLAYKILESKDPSHPYLPLIRNYFIEIKRDHKWHNTIETASILETIIPALLASSGNVNKANSLTIGGAVPVSVDSFPYSQKLRGQKITIEKKGTGPVYLTIYHKNWNKDPQAVSDRYEVQTHFEEKGKRTEFLTAGSPVEMVVEVNAKKSADYVMIEVPIPAGCSYDESNKTLNGLEIHREYFKNKTSIFCESLPIGKHVFRIKLQPRFSGSYTINPSQVELMYFPTLFGRNKISRMQIKSN